MAANTTLASANTLPAVTGTASVGTTFQQYSLSKAAESKTVTVVADVACYITFSGSTGATDGGTPTAQHRIARTGDQMIAGVAFDLSNNGNRRSDVFVAAQTGTAVVELVQE